MNIFFTKNGIFLVLLSVAFFSSQAQVSFSLPSNAAPVNVMKAEYYFDADPGFGKGTALPLTAGLNITISSASVGITGLSNGVHRLFIRTQDADNHWSLTNNQVLFIVNPVSIPSNPAVVNITAAEYYFDTDPGFGKGTALPVTPGVNITISNSVINITGLPNGVHRLYIRTRNAGGHWSLTNNQVLFIVNPVAFPSNPALANIVKAEYFFDSDPGFGKGASLAVTAGTTTISSYAVNITSLSTGIHRFYTRTQDANGHWSLTNENNLAILSTSLIIPSNPSPGNITMIEYFFDTDPGFGKGHIITVPGSGNLADYSFPVNVSELSQGKHNLFIRTFDTWSLTTVMPLSVSNPLPITLVSFTARVQPDNSVLLSWQTTSETNNQYFGVERSGNGTDFAQIGEVKGSGTTNVIQNYSFTDPGPSAGINYYRLRQVDMDGHSTYSPVVTVQIQSKFAFSILPNPVHDLLKINIAGTPEAKGVFRIIDLGGKLLMTVNATLDNDQQIDVSSLTSGSYILQYFSDKNTYTTKFIKL